MLGALGRVTTWQEKKWKGEHLNMNAYISVISKDKWMKFGGMIARSIYCSHANFDADPFIR